MEQDHTVSQRQREIAAALDVVAPFVDEAALQAEVIRRITFLGDTLRGSGCHAFVLGVSGGVDSLVAGRLAQLAVQALRTRTGDDGYRLIAVRLPSGRQHDARDARDALRFIDADESCTVPIGTVVTALATRLPQLAGLSPQQRDAVRGNIKARLRMVAQYAMANAVDGLVIGTDHAAEAVMGFFTKFGDGACDLAPLHGLVKNQIRAIAAWLGAPPHLVDKTPVAGLEDLAPDRPDEAVHGVRYADIDAFLHGQAIDAAAAARIVRAWETSAHKRALPLVP